MDEIIIPTQNTTGNTLISGTSDADFILNSADNVTIDTGDGNDQIISGILNITAEDTLPSIGNENISVSAGNGDDTITSFGNTVTIDSGDGNDNVTIMDTDSVGSAIIFGGAGEDTIMVGNNNGGNVTNSAYSLNGHKNHTVNGGTGNDYIIFIAPTDYSGNDSNMFVYKDGDGDDTINAMKMTVQSDYSQISSDTTDLSSYFDVDFSTVVQIDSGSQPVSVNSGENLIVKVGEGSITFLGMANQSLDIVDTEGNAIAIAADGDNSGETNSTDTDTNSTETNTTSGLTQDIDIVFIIDTSGSMDRYITRVKNVINNFVDSLNNENVSVRLGLVDFGGEDSIYNNSLNKTYDFTEDVETFKNNLSSLSTTGYAEYGLNAIEAALAMDFREGVIKRFILLTDEGYYENNYGSTTDIQADAIINELNNNNVVLDVVGDTLSGYSDSCYDEYKPVANATGGNFYDIDSIDYSKIFEDISDNIALPSINVNLNDVPDGAAGVFLLPAITAEDGTATVSSEAKFISLGFTPYQYNGHYYGIYTNQASWEDAKAFCEYMGGNLAVINDEAENIALYDYMKSAGYESAFFGLSDAESEGNWKWVNGDDLSYINCAAGEPNGGTSENYAMFVSSVPEYQWVDSAFYAGSAFICEWDAANLQIAGTVTDDKIYTADNSKNYKQNIIIPENWNVTASSKGDTLNVTGDNVTVAGGEGRDSFIVGNEVNGIIFADLSTSEDKLSFENAIPERSLDYSEGTALELFSDDIKLTFQDKTNLTGNFQNYIVSNGDGSNTISELLINPPNNTQTDYGIKMSFAHWNYNFTPAEN